MTPQQQARDRAVSRIRQIVRVRTPQMSEETRDQVAREIEAIVDDLVAALTTGQADLRVRVANCEWHYPHGSEEPYVKVGDIDKGMVPLSEAKRTDGSER